MRTYQLVVTGDELQLLLAALDTTAECRALRTTLLGQQVENDRYGAKHGRHLKTA